MTLRSTTALMVGTLILTLASAIAVHAKPKSFELDFDKCFARAESGNPYLFTFAGPVSGDMHGAVEASVLNDLRPGVEPGQTYLAADYVVTGPVGFTARVGGRVNDATGEAVLQGYVTAGPAWLLGAAVLDEFENYTRADGTPCSRGTLYITPVRWKGRNATGR